MQSYMFLCNVIYGALKSLTFERLCLSAVPSLFGWNFAKAQKRFGETLQKHKN